MTNASWNEPEGVRPRGTIVIFPGRGESAQTYWRLGPRLAADAYRVVVLRELDDVTAIAEESVRPVIALGADTGALAALEAGAGGSLDAVIVAGIPVGGAADALLAEISARTSCAVHQGVLADTGAAVAVAALPALIDAPAPRALDVPVLAIHGAEDQVAPLEEALALYGDIGPASIAVVTGGLHDALNDLSHRSVAATIVLFLERLREGQDLPVIVDHREPARAL